MRRVLPLPMLALLVAAGCRSGDAALVPPQPPAPEPAARVESAALPVAPREEPPEGTAGPPSPAPSAGPCCPGRPPSTEPWSPPPAEPPPEPGVLVAIGSTERFDLPGLGTDVHLEVSPVAIVPADGAEGRPVVRCTVRLRRADGRDLGPGRSRVKAPPGSPRGTPDLSTTGPAPGWTGPVPCGDEVSVTFPPVEDMPRAPYGWFVDLSATPVDDQHVRIHAEGSAPI